MDELIKICGARDVETAYICAKDRFGDYGIIGFYALKDNRLLHFLFSCRILGMGIENYVYEKLGFPEIEIVGDVRTDLGMHIEWISETEVDILQSEKNDESIKKGLLVGGCDLEGACMYLSKNYAIEKEFATVKNGYPIRTSDSIQLIAAKEMALEDREIICENIPFFDIDTSFNSKIYDDKYDFVVWSVVDDYIRCIWANKNKPSLKIGWGVPRYRDGII